ncbi:unnamed protein product, partial [Protopolystoma xenopodis]
MYIFIHARTRTKSLSKAASPVVRSHLEDSDFATPAAEPILPINAPFMVRLAKVIETRTTAFLVLEHNPGGLLHEWLADYLV